MTMDAWIDEQARHCALKLAQCISATSLVKNRAGFGQTIRPAKGSVLASPSVDAVEGQPDYFFHWLRDTAVIMEAVRLLAKYEKNGDEWRTRFLDIVEFSLSLRGLDGRRLVPMTAKQNETAPDLRQYLRSDEDLGRVSGDLVLGEVRYNPDGSLDILKWSRPQHDGPALRALVAMRFWNGQHLSAGEAAPLAQLIQGDLAYTAHHAGEVCYDIWEEEPAKHYYTCLVQCAALQQGALWAKQQGRDDEAAAYSARAQELATQLDSFWSPWKQIYRSRLLPSGMESAKDLDFSVILGVLHAGLETGLHSVEDEGVSLTMEQLEALFADEYAINREVRHHGGVAYGRYKGDRYYSGGAYFFSTFGAAEFYYRRALATPGLSQSFISKGDAILAHVREFIPPSGDLSEQFDQTTGKPTSARDLAWSYASFLTARYARQQALEQAGARSHV